MPVLTTSAPLTSNTLATATMPFATAKCNGCAPSLLAAVRSAPQTMGHSTAVRWPCSAAQCSGVQCTSGPLGRIPFVASFPPCCTALAIAGLSFASMTLSNACCRVVLVAASDDLFSSVSLRLSIGFTFFATIPSVVEIESDRYFEYFWLRYLRISAFAACSRVCSFALSCNFHCSDTFPLVDPAFVGACGTAILLRIGSTCGCGSG